ncbi:MAG: hypothetical protein B6U72_03145 [Candidatus Altiarchaeales archaeon ex4484_2]|nr:MAG: hypothetical protein B6U72_03145 [Candidatus Altiarchaeales archaeon ex4484_2]
MEEEEILEQKIQELDEDLKNLYNKIREGKIPEERRDKESTYKSFSILKVSRIREIQMNKLIMNKKIAKAKLKYSREEIPEAVFHRFLEKYMEELIDLEVELEFLEAEKYE